MVTFLNHPARLAALETGETRFDTRVPCPRCGFSLRYTFRNSCVECKAVAKRGARAVEKAEQRAAEPEPPPNTWPLSWWQSKYESTIIGKANSAHCNRVLRA